MEIKRTANAGVLLKLDGLSILIDGVCEGLYPYLATPAYLRDELTKQLPDVVAFTHKHKDHYDDIYVNHYKKEKLRSVYGPELSIVEKLNDSVNLQVIPTRHIGKCDISHASFIVCGSECVLFTGDASPLIWKNIENICAPDVLIVPYAYALTESSWKITKAFGARKIILLHLPDKNDDPLKLWQSVEAVVKDDPSLIILEMGESVIFE